MGNPAPEARRGCRLSLPTRGAENPMGSSAPCLGCCLRKDSPPPKARLKAGSACRTLRAQRVLWEAVRLVWAVACVRTAPRRRRELHAGSTRGAENPMGSDAFYNARGSFYWKIPRHRRGRGCRLSLPTRRASPPRPLGRKRVLWEAMRLVWAVACVRTAPRRRRA